jgi:serine/threonine-protein kinase
VSADTPETDPLLGAEVGPYRIEALLGVGGMGRVYRAADATGTPIALKLVRSDLASDSVFRQRFEREARIATQVVNPHVVPVVDTGEHDGVPYLAQRYIGGGSLAERLATVGRLSLGETLTIGAQVASGLDALVDAGLVHRDVKPDNVLLDEDGTAYITDFGLAKDSQSPALTRPGQALGSPHYMAPEQIRGEEVSSRTDVYSLGCVLYECATGAPPFASQHGMRVMWAQLTDLPADPVTVAPDLPPAFGPALLSGLAKEPDERPASAPDYVRALCAAAGVPTPPALS